MVLFDMPKELGCVVNQVHASGVGVPASLVVHHDDPSALKPLCPWKQVGEPSDLRCIRSIRPGTFWVRPQAVDRKYASPDISFSRSGSDMKHGLRTRSLPAALDRTEFPSCALAHGSRTGSRRPWPWARIHAGASWRGTTRVAQRAPIAGGRNIPRFRGLGMREGHWCGTAGYI